LSNSWVSFKEKKNVFKSKNIKQIFFHELVRLKAEVNKKTGRKLFRYAKGMFLPKGS
jgi:hypothetical protein